MALTIQQGELVQPEEREMRPTEEFRRAHRIFRVQLALLGQWLSNAQTVPVTIHNLTHSIVQRLRAHTEQETLAIAALRDVLREQPREIPQRVLAEYERERQLVSALAELLVKSPECRADELAACALYFIDGLQEQMAHEERELFPVLDRWLEACPAQEAPRHDRLSLSREAVADPPGAPSPLNALVITDVLTVTEVIRIHPAAREIFTAFGIRLEEHGMRELGGFRRQGIDVDALVLALNQSREFRTAMTSPPGLLWDSCDGMMVIDPQRRILAMNPALERLTGQRAHEVVGRRQCGALFDCQDAQGCRLACRLEKCPGLRAMHRDKAIPTTEYTIRTAQERRIVVNASYTPIRPAPGGPLWSLVVMRDARFQKRQELRLARQAMLDPLTGLLNRAGFVEAFGRELKRASRYARPLTMVMADLDGFKAHNDHYGHPAGDVLLKGVARAIQSSLRANELAARYGGDEFVLLLPETDAASALVVAHRVMEAVGRFPVVTAQALSDTPPLPPITVSMGLAIFPADGETLEALLNLADRRLYEAKQQGRSRVVGPPRPEERRRHPRMLLGGPVMVRSLAGDLPESWREGLIQNLGMAGVYFTILPWRPLTNRDALAFSISVPPEQQRAFPFSRLAGRGRVVRTEELPPADELSRKRLGLALEFGKEVTTLAANAGNGHEREGEGNH